MHRQAMCRRSPALPLAGDVEGVEHPWDHGHGHHDEAHAEAAPKGNFLLVDGKIKYERSEIGALPMPVEIDGDESADDDVLDDLHDEDEE
ncbi:unnamed protein product [Phytophthora lilii]|uniref:Unnamed protein product n=1 Tax=Phytophthora lilii TaxID=2077276 RepID=A0A9W6T8C4_9STRA|nr:unnamed protein product [Phytophthora lilii]